MRIFLSSLLIFAHLLCLSLPTTGAPLDDGNTDTDVQVDHGVVEVSGGNVLALLSNAEFLIPDFGAPGTIEARSWASFLSPSYIIESIQNATRALVAPKPSPPDFWEKAKECEKLLQDYVPRMLGDAAVSFKSTRFTDVTSSMHHIVNSTATFRNNIKGALDAHEITFDTLTKELEGVFMAIVNDLENIPPPDKAHGHAKRANIVDKVLDDTAVALINLATRYGIEEEVVTTYLSALKQHVEALIVTVGDINEQYPDLLPTLAFSVAVLLIPESWILKPLLSVFGFGPAGPVKGSTVAWLQSRFWGGTIKPGSWFSLLQKAGTGVYPKWASLFTKVSVWFGGLLAMVSFKRE